jgi:hypothetical protein
MTVRGRLLLFGGFFAIVILLVVVVAIIGASRPNYVQYTSVPFTAGERYLTDKFEPAFSFEAVGEGWALDGPEARYFLGLQNRGSYMDFLNAKDLMVFEPSEADKVPAPEDMVGWYQEHPYLDTEEPEPVSVGGVKGVYLETVVTPLPEGYDTEAACKDPSDPPTKRSLSLFSNPEAEYTLCLSPGDKVRTIWLEDVNGAPLSIMVWSQEFLPKAQKLLNTVEWEDT